MIIRKLILIFVFYIIIFLFSCKTEQIILPGKIKGLITDSETSEPIQGVSVELIKSYVPTDSTITGNDGTYLLKNITPGDYEVQASKFDYSTSLKDIEVNEAETRETNFNLIGIPVSSISITYLDYGLELTSLSFAISNIGKRKVTYVLTPSHSWITVYPSYGDVTDETDSINVTINKTDLSDSITYIGEIEITSIGGPSPI